MIEMKLQFADCRGIEGSYVYPHGAVVTDGQTLRDMI